MQVKNKIYYHIQRKDPNQPYWKIGDVLMAPAGPKNNFIESVLNQEYSRYAGDGLYWDSDILCHYAAVQMGFETKFSELDNSFFNSEGILRMSYTMINHLEYLISKSKNLKILEKNLILFL